MYNGSMLIKNKELNNMTNQKVTINNIENNESNYVNISANITAIYVQSETSLNQKVMSQQAIAKLIKNYNSEFSAEYGELAENGNGYFVIYSECAKQLQYHIEFNNYEILEVA